MTATARVTTTRPRRRPPAQIVRIARAALAYSRARKAVNRLLGKCDQDQADRLYQTLYRAEDRLLKVCAGARVPDESDSSEATQ